MSEHSIKSAKGAISDKLIRTVCGQLGHSDADVRKTVVFCLVEICVRHDGALDLGQYGLGASQLKLVQIYIQRRL